MKSEPKTAIYLDFMNNNSATDYDFITFVDKSKLAANVDSTSTHPLNIVHETDEGAELRMNFLLDITPDADIELIMDPIAETVSKETPVEVYKYNMEQEVIFVCMAT